MAYRRSYLKALDCLGTALLVELGRLSDFRMADGLMTLVDEVEFEGVSLLAREALGLEAKSAVERSIKQANSSDISDT